LARIGRRYRLFRFTNVYTWLSLTLLHLQLRPGLGSNRVAVLANLDGQKRDARDNAHIRRQRKPFVQIIKIHVNGSYSVIVGQRSTGDCKLARQIATVRTGSVMESPPHKS
jgi:hypothetical protein